jgi:hypothetical protein
MQCPEFGNRESLFRELFVQIDVGSHGYLLPSRMSNAIGRSTISAGEAVKD